jgi:hypothetical protein
VKASKQLDAFPASGNQRARQLAYGAGAVVSIRLTGAVIARLDEAAATIKTNTGRWKVTRTDVIRSIIGEWLAENGKPTKKKGKKQ